MNNKNNNWGGKREGSGRRKLGRKQRKLYTTDEECKLLREYLKKIREEATK